MSGDDVRAIVEAHRANPRQVTTMAVAFCMQRYKAQIGEVLRPADLMAALGISDSMARRAVRAARAMDPESAAATVAGDGPDRSVTPPEKRNLTVPPEPHRSGTGTFRGPEPHRSAGRNGDVPHTNERDLDRGRQEEDDVAPAAAHAREGGGEGDDRPSRPFDPPEDDVDRVRAWAASIPGRETEDLGPKVGQFRTSYPLDWIEDAILCGASNARPGAAWQYAHRCLREWWATGRPDYRQIADAREAAGTSRHVPPSVARRQDVADAFERYAEEVEARERARREDADRE